MRIFLTTVWVFVVTFSCQSVEVAQPDKNQLLLQDDTSLKIKYLALGDSYTIGHGVAEAERYPVQLKSRLLESGISVEKLQIIARTGWTTDELSSAMDQAEFDASYDLVTLLIGVNNQYRGRSPESFEPEFAALLSRAIALAGGDTARVVVLSIPDWGATPFAGGRDRDKIAREIDAYNAINCMQSDKAGVAWINVTPISREAISRPELIAPDNLHPSGLMYGYWIEDLLPVVLTMLKEK
jgi:lysophospholipase L1-like esterase